LTPALIFEARQSATATNSTCTRTEPPTTVRRRPENYGRIWLVPSRAPPRAPFVAHFGRSGARANPWFQCRFRLEFG